MLKIALIAGLLIATQVSAACPDCLPGWPCPCGREAVVEGMSQLTAGGTGGGNLGSGSMVRGELGQTASVRLSGDEKSECNENSGRTRSSVSAWARVSYAADGVVSFASDATANGGHYRTAAGCFAGEIVGITGHDTEARVAVEMKARVSLPVHKTEERRVLISWEAVPANSTLTIWTRLGAPSQVVPLPVSGTHQLAVTDDGLIAFEISMRGGTDGAAEVRHKGAFDPSRQVVNARMRFARHRD